MQQFIKFINKLRSYGGYFYPALIVFLLSSIFFFFYSYYNYIDLLNLCVINIDEDILRGNKKTIQFALKEIRDADKSSYKDVCKYVQLISENSCPIYHTYGGRWQYNNQQGCYIKGSKVIYINPVKENTDSIVDQRVGAIKKYADLSKNYWDTK